MNIAELFHKLGMILGLVHGNDTTTTGLTTSGNFKVSTTPMIIDTSSLGPFSTSDDLLVSKKFLSSIATDPGLRTTENLKKFSDVDESTYPPTKTSTAKQESTVFSTITSHPSSVPSVATSEVPDTTYISTSNETTDKKTDPTENSTFTGSDTTENSTFTGSETVTDSVKTENNTVTGTENITITDSVSTDNNTVTDSVSTDNNTVTDSVSTDNNTVTDSISTDNSTVTGTESTENVTVTEHTKETGGTEVTPTGSDVTPTEKPGLTKGAVAGIVVGSLLAVAIIAAAIVFVYKQRSNSPETRRLNV